MNPNEPRSQGIVATDAVSDVPGVLEMVALRPDPGVWEGLPPVLLNVPSPAREVKPCAIYREVHLDRMVGLTTP